LCIHITSESINLTLFIKLLIFVHRESYNSFQGWRGGINADSELSAFLTSDFNLLSTRNEICSGCPLIHNPSLDSNWAKLLTLKKKCKNYWIFSWYFKSEMNHLCTQIHVLQRKFQMTAMIKIKLLNGYSRIINLA